MKRVRFVTSAVAGTASLLVMGKIPAIADVKFSRIAANHRGEVFAVTENGDAIHKQDKDGNWPVWHRPPFSVYKIAVPTDGKPWVIVKQGNAEWGPVKAWDGNAWQDRNGPAGPANAHSIAAGTADQVYHVGAGGKPFLWTGGAWQEQLQGSGIVIFTGTTGVTIAVGPDGALWHVTQDRHIDRWNGGFEQWGGDNVASIAVDGTEPRGICAHMGNGAGIWIASAPGGWVQQDDDKAKDLAASLSKQFWYIGMDNVQRIIQL